MIKSIEMEVSFLPLTQDNVAIVDTEDYDYVNHFKWCTDNNLKPILYARRAKHMGMINGKQVQKPILMHRDIMDAPKGTQVDHINGNGLDNRRSNLRFATNRQNQQNRHDVTSSRYPGVGWNKHANKWVSRIWFNGKRKHLGCFTDEREAAMVYERACREVVGEELICKT